MTTPQKGNSGVSAKGSPAPKSGQAMTKATRAMRVLPTDHAAPNNAIITHRARAAAQRKAQRAMLQDSVKNGGNAAKKLSGTAVQAIKAVGRGVASAVSSLLTAGGGAVVLVLFLTVILVAAIVASPFGILFSNESREAGVVPISAAVAQINYDFNAELEALQTAEDYDSISVTGQPADWVEVLAVFAVKVAGSNDADAADVATMDADRIARLKAVFWDMTVIKTEVETINHPGSGDDDGWTERNLYITVTAKTAEEMKTAYHFNRNQIAALDELLEQRDLLRELIEDVYSVSGDTAALLRDLPEGLSTEREAVVRTACSLVGKVNYFWGGKSLVIGWDARWGELRQVTAAGSSTTGTYRPYGLDCSGFVDWVFYNATGGDYIIGHGGGAMMQHTYCTPILWEDAINKNVTEEEILRSCRTAFSGGWSSVKLYFMLGLPTETDEDVLGIAELAEKVYKAWKECTPNPKRGVTITVSTACFVPKPHTAFQWEAQVSMEEYRRRVKLLRDNMRGRSIRYNWHDPDTSFLEAVFSRGDRRVADVIEEAWRQGAKFDAWSEYFDFDRWMAAFDACGLDPALYANRVREKDEVLPWSVTSTGVTTPFLWRERERAYQAVITPDCRVQCTGCGADKLYPGGKCDAEA